MSLQHIGHAFVAMIGVCAGVRISKSTKESTDCKSEATLLILLSGAEVDFVSGVMADKYPTLFLRCAVRQ
jgi:hypothetical protein